MDRPLLRRISWPQVALGFVLALVASLAAPQIAAASVAGVAGGGFVGARFAARDGLLQGSAVAALWILAADLLNLPVVPADTLPAIGFDLLHLVAGAGGGWLATRS